MKQKPPLYHGQPGLPVIGQSNPITHLLLRRITSPDERNRKRGFYLLRRMWKHLTGKAAA